MNDESPKPDLLQSFLFDPRTRPPIKHANDDVVFTPTLQVAKWWNDSYVQSLHRQHVKRFKLHKTPKYGR